MDSPRRELSNDGLEIAAALAVFRQLIFSCVSTGGPIQLYPTQSSLKTIKHVYVYVHNASGQPHLQRRWRLIEAIYTFYRGDKEVSHAFLFSATIQSGHYSPILIFLFSQLGYTSLNCNIQALAATKVFLPALQMEQITGGTLANKNTNTIVSFCIYFLFSYFFLLVCGFL